MLGFGANSGCEFFRNGSWYDGKKAEAHLRYKYEMLEARDRINTAEDFIEEAATKSSLSGQRYQIRCGGHDVVTSSQWLRDVLARYRAHTHSAHHAQRVAHLGPTYPVQSGTSVVRLDFNVAVDRLYVFGPTRNGHCLVRRLLGSGAAAQPHDSVVVGVDMNAPRARTTSDASCRCRTVQRDR